MISMLRAMQKKSSEIAPDVVMIFEEIVERHQEVYGKHLVGFTSFKPEWDDEFCQAMDRHLTREQRFFLYETQGGCNGAGADKLRKAFAMDHANLALDERMALFAENFGRWKPELNEEENTLTLEFKCGHGYYKQAREGKYEQLPENIEAYFERCAGGRLYELQKALGIKLQIASVDVTSLDADVNAPVKFVFRIAE